jgi:tRNA(Ile)-lysidine synthase TilS/MesJ
MLEICEGVIATGDKLPLLDIERSIETTYRKDIFKPFVKAITEYELLKPNDKVAVAISGGKDSLLLAKLFQTLKRHNKIPFELVFITMNPGFHPANLNKLKENCAYLNIPVIIEDSHIFDVVEKIAKEHPCYLCARMRRGFLYAMAKKYGCNKLALGHHFDDVIETSLLSLFYGGEYKTMVPKVTAENYPDMELIRPMVLIKEKDIVRFTKRSGLQTMNCGFTVAALKTASKRREIKELIKHLNKINPDIEKNIFAATKNVNIDALFGYQKDGIKYSFVDIYNKKGSEEK